MKLPKQLLTGLLFTVFIFSVLSSSVNCQIKIKETVNINPSIVSQKKPLSITSAQYLPCGPFPAENDNPHILYQVLFSGLSYPLDPYQQPLYNQNSFRRLFALVDNFYYDVTIVEGSEFVTL
jgi:hypothetical protein